MIATFIRFLVRVVVLCVIVCLTFVLCLHLNYLWVSLSHTSYALNEVEALPNKSVAVVLGTSPRMADGRINLFFEYRMDAAAELYHAGKVQKILVSGSNDGGYYDESESMHSALVKRGVPRDIILQDRAGYRTLDSILRARDVFGLNTFIIVSQPFHNQRALYIARHYNINALAYNAQAVTGWDNIHAQVREHFARVLMMLDLYITETQPRTLESGEFVNGKPLL